MLDDVVVPADPTPAPEDLTPDPDAAGSVTPVPEVSEDRPLRNIQAEFNRKHSQTQAQIQELTSLIREALAPKAPVVANSVDQYSNEQLAQLAQAGSAEAQAKLTERLVQAQVQAQLGQHTRVQGLQAAHMALYTKYPQLTDTMHPLTQYAMQVKAALLRQGAPNSVETDVEAIKTAIVDNARNPSFLGTAQDLSEPVRRAGVTTQSQIDGSAPRRTPPPPAPGAPRKLSEKELALAKRMGLTPEQAAGSMARFEKRQAAGTSSLGAVRLHVAQEGG